MKSLVLDTSALVTLIEDEAGVEEVAALVEDALAEQVHLYLSVIAKIELFYISVQEQGEAIANERMELLDDLPVRVVDVTEDLVEVIGQLKAKHSMSFADCCIAGLAVSLDAELVHKDPEYEQVKDRITLRTLPYKPTKNHT